jgi:hypothetical protein
MILWSFLDLMFSILGNFSLFIFALVCLYISATWKCNLLVSFLLYMTNPSLIFSIYPAKKLSTTTMYVLLITSWQHCKPQRARRHLCGECFL